MTFLVSESLNSELPVIRPGARVNKFAERVSASQIWRLAQTYWNFRLQHCVSASMRHTTTGLLLLCFWSVLSSFAQSTMPHLSGQEWRDDLHYLAGPEVQFSNLAW
jgi:hypothetical protein